MDKFNNFYRRNEMSKEVKTQEQETPKSNKKYIALALVAILAVIGIVDEVDMEGKVLFTKYEKEQ